MGKLKSYLMLDKEHGQKLLQDYQKECDSYNTLSPEEIQSDQEKMLSNDPGYYKFLDSLEDKNCPF